MVHFAGLRVALLWLAIVALATWLLPNSYQIFVRFNPVNNLSRKQLNGVWAIEELDWKITSVLSAMFVLSILHLSRASPFLYFQF